MNFRFLMAFLAFPVAALAQATPVNLVLEVSGSPVSGLVATNSSGAAVVPTLGSSLSYNASTTTLDTAQAITTGASPTFAGLTTNGFSTPSSSSGGFYTSAFGSQSIPIKLNLYGDGNFTTEIFNIVRGNTNAAHNAFTYDTIQHYGSSGTAAELQLNSGGGDVNIGSSATIVTVNGTTASTSTSTGALVVAGGVGIGGKIFSAGDVIALGNSLNFNAAFQSTFNASSSDGISLADSSDTSGAVFMVFGNGSGSIIGTIARVGTTNAVSYNTTSDQRLKSNFHSWSLGDTFDQIPIGEFTWKASGEVGHGTLAQQLYSLFPDAVTKGDDGVTVAKAWQVDYSKLVIPTIARVQEDDAKIAALEARVEQLEAMVAALQPPAASGSGH